MAERTTDPYADVLENRRQLEEWQAKKKHEAEEAQRQQKRARLEAHQAERARTYFDHTGTTPPTSLLQNWQEQYLDRQELARQAEREARLAELDQEHYRFP